MYHANPFITYNIYDTLQGKGDNDTDQLFVFFPKDAKKKVSLKATTVITVRMK